VRALLVPALMRLFGEVNGWMPHWTRVVLRVSEREPNAKLAPEIA
jgi:hypothetical protein